MQAIVHPPTIRDFLYVLFKYKLTIAIFIATATIVAILYPTLVPLRYEAAARILIKAGREDVQQGMKMGKYGPTTITNVNNQELINSEIELLKGRHLAEEVVSQLETDILYPPKEQPVTLWQKVKASVKATVSSLRESVDDLLVALGLTKKLSPREKAILMVEGGLKTEVIKNSNTAKISFKSANPDLAAKIVNAAVATYLKNRPKVLTSSDSLDFFSKETDRFKASLQDAEQKLKVLKETKNISSIDEQKKHLLDLIAEVRTQMNKNDSELSRLNERVNKISSLTKVKASGTAADRVINPNEVIDTLKIKLTDLKLKRLGLLDKHLDDSPMIAEIDEEIKAIENELNNETAISSVAVDISSLQATRASLGKAYSKLTGELKDLTHSENELKNLNRDVNRNEEFYKIYSDKTEESRIYKAMDTAHITNVSVVEPAYAPIVPMRTIKFIPQRMFIIAMALVMSCLISICFVALMETLDHSLKSSDDVSHHIGLPLLGVVSEKTRYSKRIGSTHP